DPADERAAWFLRRARLAEDRGDVAGPAFFDALAAYDAGDPERARRLLEEAVAAEPGFAEAWGYLGRIAFQQGRYADAAVAYERAAELAPAVGEYAFFAEEAMRLAGEAAAADDGGEAAETAPATPDAPPDAPPSPDGEGAEPPDAPPGDGAEGDDAPGPPAGDEGSPGAPSGDDADGDEPPDAPGGGPVLRRPPGDGGDEEALADEAVREARRRERRAVPGHRVARVHADAAAAAQQGHGVHARGAARVRPRGPAAPSRR